jgi:hypothetical protein
MLACLWAKESEGGGEKIVRCGGRLLLKWRQGRSGSPVCGAAWRRKWGRERGSGFSDVDRHDSDAAAPDRSDSCGRRTPRGRGGCAANRGGRRGPVGSDGVRER